MYTGKAFLTTIGILMLFLLFGCSKPNSEPTDYTFENLADKQVNIDIYYSEEDYFNNANVIASGSAKVRGYYIVPLSKLETGHVYYVDIYSDDYLYNNWFWSNVSLRDTFVPTATTYDYIVQHTQYSDPSRSIWLNGAGPTTTWKAFDAYTKTGSSFTSIWSSLSSAEQDLQVVMRKSSYATVTNGLGLDTTLKYTAFYDQTTNISTATMLNPDKTTYATFSSYFNATTLGYNGSKDTMFAAIGGLGYFALARQ